MAMWDKEAKVGLKALPNSQSFRSGLFAPTAGLPILGCAFHPEGTVLAVAIGDDYSQGVPENRHSSEIFLRHCAPDEVQLKRRWH